MTTNCISSLAWLSGSSRSLRAWSWTYEFGRDALCSLETVSSCGCTAGLHIPASLGGYWTTLPSIPWGYDLETVSSSLWMHCWTTFPSVPWGGAMRPCDNSTQSDASISDAGQPVCNLYCFPFSWLSGMHVIVEQSLMHTGP